MIVCLEKSYKTHKHVRKLTTACGRNITHYCFYEEFVLVTCVTKPGARPLWYTSDYVNHVTIQKTRVLNCIEHEHMVALSLQLVNCVDCLASPYYALAELAQTNLE